MIDPIFRAFLENTSKEAAEIATKSDVLNITPLPPLPPSSYLCEFSLEYIRRLPTGRVEIASGPVLAAVHFPEDYLRSIDPHLYVKVVSVLTTDLTHPNLRGTAACLGSGFAPGTPITMLLWELYDIISYQNVGLDERNALNPEGCRLLRQHPHLLDKLSSPLPFMRRERKIQIKVEKI